MEAQTTLTGESINKNVGKSITRNKNNVRIISYYNQLIGSLGDRSKPEILPFRENAEKVSRVSENERVENREEKVMFDVYNKRLRDECPTLTDPCHNSIRVYDEQRKGFRDYTGYSPTMRANVGTGGNNVPMVVAQRGRNPENPSDRTTGIETNQRFEINKNGTSNCLSTIQKDNLVCDNVPMVMSLDTGNMQGVARCLDSNMYKGTTPESFFEKKRRNIVGTGKLRRLTPIECERLQSFPDNFTKYGINEKGEQVPISDTQRYKMMGNAVTVNVIEEIMKELSK